MSDEFKGIVPAIITPFTADGQVNEEAYRQVMEFNIKAGVHGFWVCGGTGEGVILDDEERIRIAEISVDQAKGRAKIIMHVGATTTRSAVRIAERAGVAGVDAVCSVPPLLYRTDDDTIIAYYRAISEAGGVPFFVYNLPQMTGVEVMPPLMERLVKEVPNLTGMKHSALAIFNIYPFTNMGVRVFTGNSGLLLPAMTMGAVGCVDGPPGIAPEVHLDAYNAHQKGDLATAQEAQRKAMAIKTLCMQFPFAATCKAVLSERLGIDCGDPRPPIRALTSDERQEVVRQAKALGIA